MKYWSALILQVFFFFSRDDVAGLSYKKLASSSDVTINFQFAADRRRSASGFLCTLDIQGEDEATSTTEREPSTTEEEPSTTEEEPNTTQRPQEPCTYDQQIASTTIATHLSGFLLFSVFFCWWSIFHASISADCECGEANNSNRIVGGGDADKHEYPWQVRLKIGRSGLCGGTIITTRHVLTAAHCTQGQSARSVSICFLNSLIFW